MDTRKATEEVMQAIRAVNRSYQGGWHEDDFCRHIHPDVVAVFPDTPGRVEGREAYVAEWRGFCQSAVILERQETGHLVRHFTGGKSAVVTYLFSVTFTIDDKKQTMQGRDMFFLVKEGRRWLVVAQQFSEEPAAA